MPQWNSFSFIFGPLVAFVGIGLMVMVLRWAFSRGHSIVERPARSGDPSEYGMLIPVAAPNDYIQGEMLRQKLAENEVKATLATTNDGPRILVWPADRKRAEAVLKKGR